MRWITAQAPFRIPEGVTPEGKVEFCIGVINRYRKELPVLRTESTKLKDKTKELEEQVKYWKQKYQEEKREKEKIKKELEKVLNTKNRYQIALFDHGNFKHPGKSTKQKGGQIGHGDTNREIKEDYRSYVKKRLFATYCGKCHTRLSRVTATKQKILLDIVINPEVITLFLESERQWCGTCKKEVNAREERSLPFTEYGINTIMIVMLLRFRAHASMGNIATIIKVAHGINLSKSDVSNLLRTASHYLGNRYEHLKKEVRSGNIMYNDETGWMVHGQKAWMWIMANERETVYVAAESRGKGIAEGMYGNSQAYAMTDGLASYLHVIPKEKHLYCWSHMLRFSYEETVNSQKDSDSVFLRDELVRIYHIKSTHPEYGVVTLKTVLTEEIDTLLELFSTEEAYRNIQRRLTEQKDGLIQALLVTESGTNNLAERELRNIAIKRSISNGSDTYCGMQTSAIVGSVLQTLSRNYEVPFFPTLQSYLTQGVQEKYPQYKHPPSFAP